MKWLLTILVFLICFNAESQVQPERMISAAVIMQAYKGDLSDSYQKYSGAFQASLLFNKKEKWNGGFNLTIGKITGQTLSGIPTGNSPQPNTFFKSSVVSLHYDLRYNVFVRKNLKVYMSLGFGLLRYNPKDEEDNNLQDLTDTRAANETYGNVSLMLPLQAGTYYFLSNGYGFNFQLGFMNPLTDYLDNVSDLGDQSGSDNVLQFKFAFLVPVGK